LQASGNIIRGLASTASEVFVSDFAGGNIKVYNASTNDLQRSWSVTRPGPLALDGNGNLWVLTYNVNAYGPGNTVYCYSPAGSLLNTINLAAGVEAKSIAVDIARNELLLTDIGDNMQIHIYDNLTTTPAFTQSLGVQGGILSGTKGLVAPLKFNVPSLVGVDANSNIIVWSNGNNSDPHKQVDYDGMGSSLESYTRAGVRNWQLLGLIFVDAAAFDPATDGADLYTKHERYSMDYAKPDGQQWTWKSWTLDHKTYANSDKRLRNDGGHVSGIVMRRINGQKFMYLSNQAGQGYWVYRFTDNDEIAVPCGYLITRGGWTDTNANGQEDAGETTVGMNWQYDMFATCVDKKGDIWYAYDDIRKHSLQSIVNGVPIYNTATPTTIDAKPAPFYDVRHVEYDSDNDVMYITGYTPEKPYTGDWKSVGLVLARYNNWSTGNRTPAYTMDLPSADGGAGANMVSIALEKDYIFVMGVQTRGKVWVYYSANGLLAGTMVPGDNVGGVSKTGWGDMVNSIGAFRRSTGEYLVTVEENGWGKILIYRWTPGPPPAENEMFITSPADGGKVIGGTDIEVKAVVIDSDNSIDKVEFYNGTTLLGSDDTAPYVFTWQANLPIGTYTLTAKAYDNGIVVGTSKPTSFQVYQLPDLEVTDINWTPADPAVGTPVTFSVTIRNIGLGPVPAGVIIGGIFEVDGSLVNWTDNYQSGLAPGASAVIAATWGPSGSNTWVMQQGTHRVSFLVDDVNRINEKREDNNRFSIYIKDAECASKLCATSTGLLLEQWNGIGGNKLQDLLNNPNYPNNPSSTSYLSKFETPSNAGDDYGARVRGYVIAPVTGNYTFWIASDDESMLRLNTDENPINMQNIGWVPEWTNPREWDKFAEQKSDPIPLVAGQKYYIDAVMKEGVGGDNLAVGWQLPDGTMERPIPGNRLEPIAFAFTAPDLVVTRFFWDPANLTSGTPVTFSAIVKNIGTAATPAGTPVKVAFSVDDQPFEVVSTNALGLGDSATLTATLTSLSNGLRVLKVVVDPSNDIAETDEDYNLRTRTVFITIVLPLRLISFTAKLANGKSNLKWVSENEINVSHFDVERSSDGNRFEKLTEITSKGGGIYNMVDAAPLKGVNYYRLKMVDKDGKFTYSNIEVVKVLSNAGFGFNMYPNPNKGILILEPSLLDKPVTISIFDQQGRMVLVKQITGITSININQLANGVYTVKMIHNTDIKTAKLIKQ